MASWVRYALFQSTLPVRGATPPFINKMGEGRISIHAPREGSDPSVSLRVVKMDFISIHAPREGSDRACYPISPYGWNFNPRSP